MGIFDKIFQAKIESPIEKPIDQIITNGNNQISNSDFNINLIPKETFKLLWFGDGPYKNYQNDKSSENIEIGNISILIEFLDEDPSVIFTDLPIENQIFLNIPSSIGYYPAYKKLTPPQRYIYLKWLFDITQIIDIGYVFIFYYGLERHLIYGDYKNAIKIIKKLREYHKNASFLTYSRIALIMTSIIKKDKILLEDTLTSLEPDERNDNTLLIAKYLSKIDLTPDEIIALSSKMGFSNQNYIKKYPQIFKEVLADELFKTFNKRSYPFYELQMEISKAESIVFANYTFDMNLRCPKLPDLINNDDLKNSLYNLLFSTHKEIKIQLAESRKSGMTITSYNPLHEEPPVTDYISSLCPYCNTKLTKLPQTKKKCEFCKESISVRTRPLDKKKILLREDQIKEFEIEKENYYRNKSANKIIANFKERYPSEFSVFNNNVDNPEIITSERDTVFKIIDREGNDHYNNLEMGLYRNSILIKGDFLFENQDYFAALQHYLLVCFIDLNGPKNVGTNQISPQLFKEYAGFDPTNDVNTRFAPGVIAYIKNIANKLSLSIDDIQNIYRGAQFLILNRDFPLDYLEKWNDIKELIIKS